MNKFVREELRVQHGSSIDCDVAGARTSTSDRMWCCSMDRNRFKPWHSDQDDEERNARARKAYTALLTVTARTPDNEDYRNFSNEVSPEYRGRGRGPALQSCPLKFISEQEVLAKNSLAPKTEVK